MKLQEIVATWFSLAPGLKPLMLIAESAIPVLSCPEDFFSQEKGTRSVLSLLQRAID